MEERRKSPRFTIDQLIELSFDREQFIPTRIVDLSTEGFSCRVSEAVEPLVRVFAMVRLENGSDFLTISSEGVVVHCRRDGDEFRIGVEWSELGGEARAAILRLQNERLPMKS